MKDWLLECTPGRTAFFFCSHDTLKLHVLRAAAILDLDLNW